MSGPVATARPTAAPNAVKAVARSLPWNSWLSMAGPTANITAAPTPWIARNQLSALAPSARPQAREATVKTAKPTWKSFLRPIRSASEPAATRKIASVRA